MKELIKREVKITGTELQPTHVTEHKIDVQDHEPIKQRYYYVSPKIREYMYEEIDKMLEEDVIERSNSDWSNPVVMIKKPNGKYRFCLDCIKVNKITKKDLYPIPIMAEILDALRLARYISKIKANNSIHSARKRNVPIQRMPFGLINAPATFQRLMHKIITPNLKPNVFCYLEDIIIVTQNIDNNNHVIAFASRSLNEAERKYSTSEKECLAVVWSIRKFRPYLEGYAFKVITDHIALKWLHNLKNPTRRLTR